MRQLGGRVHGRGEGKEVHERALLRLLPRRRHVTHDRDQHSLSPTPRTRDFYPGRPPSLQAAVSHHQPFRGRKPNLLRREPACQRGALMHPAA